MRQEVNKEVNEHSGEAEHIFFASPTLSEPVLLLGCLLLTLLLWLCPYVAFAADVFCGVDTDQSGTASNPCPEPDKDHDGYPSSSAYTGPYGTDVDCDDTDYFMHTGVSTTSGCAGGEYKTCQADGTFTACATTSAFTCHTGSGHTYWVDDAETDCTGAGTYADPENWFCWFDTAMTGYHAVAAGDCIVFQAGTYSGTWSDGGTARQMYFANKDGLLATPITFREEPGTRPVINGAGTAPTEVYFFKSEDSDYIKVRGFTFDGSSDYSGNAIWFAGGTGVEAWNNYIKNVDGESDFNMAGIKCSAGTSGCNLHHNLIVDTYERGNATDQNSGAITVMDDTGTVYVWYNTVVNATPVGHGIWIKHAEDTCTPKMSYNFISGIEDTAIGSENKDTEANHNWIADCTSYALRYKTIGTDQGWFKDSTFNYNTIQRCAFLLVKADWSELNAGLGHRVYDGTTVFTADHNIIHDDNASYDGDAGDGLTRANEYGCTDGEFAAGAGKMIWTNNVYYNAVDTTLQFGYFGQEGGGADYANLTDWQAAGFDSGSVQADPSLDSDGISVTYAAYGWRAGEFTAAAPSSTGTTTGGTGGVIVKNRRRRK